MAAAIEQSTEEKAAVYMVGEDEVRLTMNMVKKHLVKGGKPATDSEIVMFINLCKFQKLNPFVNDAFLVKYGDAAQLVVSKEAREKRAEDDPHYEGRKAGLILQRGEEIIEIEGEFKLPSDKLLGGWAEVHRNDRKFPFVAKVSLAEYDKGQSTWKTHPCTMIRKTAISHALKEAFPKLAIDGALDEAPTKKEIATSQIEARANTGNEISFGNVIEGAYTEVPEEPDGLQSGEVHAEQVSLEDAAGF